MDFTTIWTHSFKLFILLWCNRFNYRSTHHLVTHGFYNFLNSLIQTFHLVVMEQVQLSLHTPPCHPWILQLFELTHSNFSSCCDGTGSTIAPHTTLSPMDFTTFWTHSFKLFILLWCNRFNYRSTHHLVTHGFYNFLNSLIQTFHLVVM